MCVLSRCQHVTSAAAALAAFARREDSALSGARLLQVIFRRIIKADYLEPPNVRVRPCRPSCRWQLICPCCPILPVETASAPVG